MKNNQKMFTTPPSAPLPKKLPPRTPESTSPKVLSEINTPSMNNSLPLLPSRPKGAQSRRLPHRSAFCLDSKLSPDGNNSKSIPATTNCINDQYNENQDNTENINNYDEDEDEVNNIELNINEVVEINESEENNNENDVYLSNSQIITQSQLQPTTNTQNVMKKQPSPKNVQEGGGGGVQSNNVPHLNSSMKKLTPKVNRKLIRETKESPSIISTKKYSSPAKKLPQPNTNSNSPQLNSHLKSKLPVPPPSSIPVTTNSNPNSTITTTRPMESSKPTFQQRIDSWLKHSEHREDAPNPFLSVLKEE